MKGFISKAANCSCDPDTSIGDIGREKFNSPPDVTKFAKVLKSGAEKSMKSRRSAGEIDNITGVDEVREIVDEDVARNVRKQRSRCVRRT